VIENYNLQLSGSIGSYYKRQIQRISEMHAEKLQYLVKNQYSLHIHIKPIKGQYLVRLRIRYPGRSLGTVNIDYNIQSATHKCFLDLEKTLRRKFRKVHPPNYDQVFREAGVATY